MGKNHTQAPEAASGAGKFRGKKRLYYERLMELRAQMMEELETLSGYSLTQTKQAGEELADIGSENFIREMELGLMTEEGRRVQLIEEALRRLNDGTYGVCTDCKQKIQEGRLEAMPYARLCVQCKAKREEAEEMYAPREEPESILE